MTNIDRLYCAHCPARFSTIWERQEHEREAHHTEMQPPAGESRTTQATAAWETVSVTGPSPVDAVSQPTPTTAGVTEAMVKALKPFACIADSEPNTPDGESTIVNIARCRDARAALDKFEAALAPSGDGVPGMVLVPKGWKPTHKHVKRGSEYEIVGKAEVQCSAGDGLTEAELVIVYRGKNGDLWVRRVSEFEDGRFVALTASTAGGGK